MYLFFICVLIFRLLLNDKVRDILSDRAKKRRAEICQVNIKVTFIVWLVEFFGCMTMAIDFLVVGSRSNALTGLLRTLTILAYFVLLPVTFLVNCHETKEAIMDSSWRTALEGIFKSSKKDSANKASEESSKPTTQSESTNTKSIFIISKGKIVDNKTSSANDSQRHRDNIKTQGGPLNNNHKKKAWT